TAGRHREGRARMVTTAVGAQQRLRLLVGTLLLTASAGWTAGCSDRPLDPTDAVVNGRRALQTGDPVAGTLHSSSDTVRYVIRTPGDWLRVFLQARSTRAEDTLFVLVRDSARRASPLTAQSAGSDLSL